jgi:signal transduction histidine kinase
MVLAGELHDEVLPPLFKVHLMGQVLRQDLNQGRLLDLDEDIPELIEATQTAQSVVRDLVRNLRGSSLGAGGLVPSLDVTVRQLEAAGAAPIRLDVEPFEALPAIQQVVYQVAKEGIVNAAKYSRASEISVRIAATGQEARVIVTDDGIGFDSNAIDRDNHFGLQFARDRVEGVGGRLVVDSRLGSGTTLTAVIPLRCA